MNGVSLRDGASAVKTLRIILTRNSGQFEKSKSTQDKQNYDGWNVLKRYGCPKSTLVVHGETFWNLAQR